eukprot:gene2010-12986_t
MSHQERLQRFYSYYDPGRLDDVASILTKYQGQEEAMFQQLVEQYGPEPTAASTSTDYKPRLIRFYQAYDPGKVAQADVILAKHKGNEEMAFKILVSKY